MELKEFHIFAFITLFFVILFSDIGDSIALRYYAIYLQLLPCFLHLVHLAQKTLKPSTLSASVLMLTHKSPQSFSN